jgi:aldehyde dehydrogenase (NAD+)
LTSEFVSTLKTISKVENQWDDTTYQGPQVSQAQYDRVISYIDIGKSEGATVIAGGAPHEACTSNNDKGFYVQPTVFTGVKESMRVYREELFGPVVVIAGFATEDEAVEAANNTTYGLGAAVFTNDLKRAHRVAAGIEAGMVWINSTQDCDPRISFDGVKLSGIGRELEQARLEAYPLTKAVHVNMGTEL